MQAVYDLSQYPANFNFAEFLSASVSYGATHVIFKNVKNCRAKYSQEETQERINSILIPCCKLMGVTYEFGNGKGIDPSYHIGINFLAYKKTGTIGKFKAPPTKCDYTVTIRNSKRYPQRNSNIEAWDRFAKEIGAVVIPDYADRKMSLEEKVSLYAGAKMNYFVPNGLASTCYFSDYPYCYFMFGYDKDYHARQGFTHGTQFPWANERQRIFWEKDDYKNIIRAHESMTPIEKYYWELET